MIAPIREGTGFGQPVVGVGPDEAQTASELAQDPPSAALFPVGKSQLANPALARTLEAIATQGRAGFYEGEVAVQLLVA